MTHDLAHPGAECAGILLAGGYGRRYAQAAGGADKLLARLDDGRLVAQASAQAMLAALPRVWAVVRPESQALARLLAGMGCRVIEAEEARDGMGASLAAAARVLMEARAASSAAMSAAAPMPMPAPMPARPSGWTHCLVALADMPWIRPASLAQVAAAGRGHAIAAAAFQGRRGHPVSFAAALWPELAALAGDAGARGLVARHGAALVETDDPGVLADVDHPADLIGVEKKGP